MVLGIVGSEAAKFTPITANRATNAIYGLIEEFRPWLIVSGECHLGGVDLWAKEAAKSYGVKFHGFPPKTLRWSGGYKERNLEIAKASDVVVCITVDRLPQDYSGMRFKLCYHCGKDDHVKSGGCWTMKQAQKMGKEGRLIVIR